MAKAQNQTYALWLKRKDRQNNTSNSNLVAAKFVFYDGLRLFFFAIYAHKLKKRMALPEGRQQLVGNGTKGKKQIEKEGNKTHKKALNIQTLIQQNTTH